MSNAKKAQDRIWAFHDGPLVGYFVGQSPGEGAYVAEFIRADLANIPSPEAIVRAALERAADCCEVGPSDEWSEETRHGYLFGAGDCQRNIVTLASDPAEVAAIIKKAGEDRG